MNEIERLKNAVYEAVASYVKFINSGKNEKWSIAWAISTCLGPEVDCQASTIVTQGASFTSSSGHAELSQP